MQTGNSGRFEKYKMLKKKQFLGIYVYEDWLILYNVTSNLTKIIYMILSHFRYTRI